MMTETNTGVSFDMPDTAPKRITEDEIHALVSTLVAGVEHHPTSRAEAFRYGMRSAVAWIALHLPGTSNRASLAYRIGRFFHPLRTHAERMVQKNESVRHEFTDGWVIIARVDGHVAAMVGMRIKGRTHDGRTVYENTSITLPAYQKLGLNGILREEMIRYIESRDPRPVFFTSTKTQAVIKRCLLEMWQKIPYADVVKKYHVIMTPREIAYSEQLGWMAFEYDPLVLGTLSERLVQTYEDRPHTQAAYQDAYAFGQLTALAGSLAGIAIAIRVSQSSVQQSAQFMARFSGEHSMAAFVAENSVVTVLAIAVAAIVFALLYARMRHKPTNDGSLVP